MKIKVLIYDAKTNGLPKKFSRAEEDLNNYPNVIELGCNLIEIDTDDLTSYNIIYGYDVLIQPFRKGIEIKRNEESCRLPIKLFDKAKTGDTIESVSFLFQGLNVSANFIVCHNFLYNRNVMASELFNHMTNSNMGDYFNPDTARGCVDATTVSFIKLIEQNDKLKQWLEGKIDKIY